MSWRRQPWITLDLIAIVEEGMRRLLASPSLMERAPTSETGGWLRAPLKEHGCYSPLASGTRPLADYSHLAGQALIEEIHELASLCKGKRVLHVNATAMGGGVSEILYALVPLMRDVGLDTRLAGDHRPRGVLQRHEDPPQLAPGETRRRSEDSGRCTTTTTR